MFEIKVIRQISLQYLSLLEKYESYTNMSIDECKNLIGEIKLFWYRHKHFVLYFLNNIEADDEVSFLAGAVKLDILNNGHYEYIISGKHRIINDPFLKFSVFYTHSAEDIQSDYFNKYLCGCINDLVTMLKFYPEDFYVLPIEYIDTKSLNSYSSDLIQTSDKIVLSMFSNAYESKEQLYSKNTSYEEIECQLLPFIRDSLTYDKIEDISLSLRQKCEKYVLKNSNKLLFIKSLSEVEVFFMITSQFCMQAISVAFLSKTYNLIPFIRNDVTFQYYTMLYHTDLFMKIITRRTFMLSYIPYVVQKVFDFSDKDYQWIKGQYGNGQLVHNILYALDEDSLPKPERIVELANNFLR